MRLNGVLFRAVGVSSVFALGLASSDGTSANAAPVSKGSYAKEANAVCKSSLPKIVSVSSSTTLSQVAEKLSKDLPVLSMTIKKLGALPKPKTEATSLSTLHKNLLATEGNMRQALSAAKAKNRDAYSAAINAFEKKGSQVDAEFDSLGIRSCGTPGSTSSTATPSTSTGSPASGTSPTGKGTLLTASGSGSKTTTSFDASGSFTVHWSYDCSKVNKTTFLGTTPTLGLDVFRLTLHDTATVTFANTPNGTLSPTQISTVTMNGQASGSGTNHYDRTGEISLSVTTPCTWKVTVTGAQ
jgi:hypothetical protein